jgi:hypothetical protein
LDSVSVDIVLLEGNTPKITPYAGEVGWSRVAHD